MEYRIENYSLLLKYAYPCIEFWYKNKELAEKMEKPWRKDFYKIINSKILEKLKLIAKGKLKPNRKIEKKLEKLIPFAFLFLKKLGKKKDGKIIIDDGTIRKYFLEIHSNVLEVKKGYREIFELCKVKKGRIVKIEKNFAKVKLGKEFRKVKLDFIEKPKLNDKVVVHFFYACERI